MLVKVDNVYSLLKKLPWKWPLLNRSMKMGKIKIINGFNI